MLRVDFENHFYDASFIETMLNRKDFPYYDKETDMIYWTDKIKMPQGKLLSTLLNVNDSRFDYYNSLGISHVILGTSPGIEELSLKESIEVSEKTNKSLFELTKKYNGKCFGTATLPIKDINISLDMMEKCISEYGFVGWHTHSNFGNEHLDDDKFLPLLKKAADLGIYVYLHPQLPKSSRYAGFGFTFAGPALGFTVDTMTTLLRMIASGTFDEIPNLKIVVGHLGEALPFLLERIENRMKFIPNPYLKNKKDLGEYFKNNIWVTTSGNMSEEAFECTKKVLGIDRILFGSDYPFENATEMVNFIDKLNLSEDEFNKIYYENAEKLLNIKLK